MHLNWIKQGLIFSKHHAQLPVADVLVDRIRIYYSTRVNGLSSPMYIEVDIEDPKTIIFECTNPILSLGDPGYFDCAGIMPTAIVNYNNLKYLYYIGWTNRLDVPYHNTLGLAISSDDGKTWNKFSNGPVFGTSYMEPGFIGTVEILIEDGVWHMWYLSCRKWINYEDKMESIYEIRKATSTNGIDWLPEKNIVIPLEEGEGGISAVSIIKLDNRYEMFFSVRGETDFRTDTSASYRIKKAISYDMINWIRQDNIEINISNDYWENTMTCYPEIAITPNNIFLFYNGNGFGKTGIGFVKNNNK